MVDVDWFNKNIYKENEIEAKDQISQNPLPKMAKWSGWQNKPNKNSILILYNLVEQNIHDLLLIQIQQL